MNTLRIVKGRDITLSVNSVPLCFVTEFSASQIRENYPIKEMLSADNVDDIILCQKYKIRMTALSLFDSSVFDMEPFTITVSDDSSEFVYSGCTLVGVTRDIAGEKPITDKYEIVADTMEQREVHI